MRVAARRGLQGGSGSPPPGGGTERGRRARGSRPAQRRNPNLPTSFRARRIPGGAGPDERDAVRSGHTAGPAPRGSPGAAPTAGGGGAQVGSRADAPHPRRPRPAARGGTAAPGPRAALFPPRTGGRAPRPAPPSSRRTSCCSPAAHRRSGALRSAASPPACRSPPAPPAPAATRPPAAPPPPPCCRRRRSSPPGGAAPRDDLTVRAPAAAERRSGALTSRPRPRAASTRRPPLGGTGRGRAHVRGAGPGGLRRPRGAGRGRCAWIRARRVGGAAAAGPLSRRVPCPAGRAAPTSGTGRGARSRERAASSADRRANGASVCGPRGPQESRSRPGRLAPVGPHRPAFSEPPLTS